MNRLVQKWLVTFTFRLKRYIIITCTKPCILFMPSILHINFSWQIWVAIMPPYLIKLYSNKIIEDRVKVEKALTYIQILLWNNFPCTLNWLSSPSLFSQSRIVVLNWESLNCLFNQNFHKIHRRDKNTIHSCGGVQVNRFLVIWFSVIFFAFASIMHLLLLWELVKHII